MAKLAGSISTSIARVTATAMTALPLATVAACPYGPEQCKPGLVWREAFSADHVCVTGAERRQVANDNRLAAQRSLPNGLCRPGFVWREARPKDHVCVSGSMRAATRQQNVHTPDNVDPACRIANPLPVLKTEFMRLPAAAVPPRPSYSFTTLDSSGNLVGVSRGPLAIATDLMWDPGVNLKVSITGASPALRLRIKTYAVEWTRWGNVQLSFVDDPMQAQIRAEVTSSNSSNSLVGRGAGSVSPPARTMEFGWLTDSSSDDEVRRVVEHEFGHAFGLIHEHQSPAAGIAWDRAKVLEYYGKAPFNWSEAEIQTNVLDQAPSNSTNYSQFDPHSIMEYPIDANLTTNGYSVGWNDRLSDTDKSFFAKFYPYPPGSTGTIFTGDDCDTIAFDLAQGVVNQAGARLILRLHLPVSWYKGIKVPLKGGGFTEISAEGSGAGDRSIPLSILDRTRPIHFVKAKFLGAHTELGFTWDMLPAMNDRSRLILDWNRDSCLR